MVLAAAVRQDGPMATTVTEGEPQGLRMPSVTSMRWQRRLATFAELMPGPYQFVSAISWFGVALTDVNAETEMKHAAT
jgi:hypothetical protein